MIVALYLSLVASDGLLLKGAHGHQTLRAEIASARLHSPRTFTALQSVYDQLPKLDANRRGNLPLVTPVLKRLGKDALLPMLDAIAFTAPTRTGLSETAERGWRLGLIEATGMLRDPRALPVLQAILTSADNDVETQWIAAQAIARLGSDAALEVLLPLTVGAKHDAVLAGLGVSRRLIAAQTIAKALDGSLTPVQAKALVRSLSDVGNAWAWELGSAHPSEQAQVRETAARALVQAFVAYDGEVRASAAAALLVVDYGGTPALITQATVLANAETAAALQSFALRFASNPTR